MKARIITTLCFMVMLSLGWFSQAAAWCENKYRPIALAQIVTRPDGSKDVWVAMQDKDYQSRGALYLYQNGQLLESNTMSGAIRRWMPKGAGNWSFLQGDLTPCGTEVNRLPAVSVEN